MKTINILIFIGLCLFALSCNKDKPEPNKNKLVGTWVEKYPEKFGGISDTLIFTNDFYVKKHKYYNNWKYSIVKDTILVLNNIATGKSNSYFFKYINDSMIVINCFQYSLLTEECFNQNFVKLNKL